MNRKFPIGVLFILAIFTGATYINFVSAETVDINAAPSVSTTIVISQVYGGGGGTTGTYINDYIELFNISNAPQTLNGLALQYGSATGQFGSTAGNIFALPDVTLQPGQHYLAQVGPAGTAGAALPVTPDVVTPNLTVSGTNGKVALTNTATALGCGATATPCALPDPRIIDVVSYGTSNNAEGGVTVNNGASLTSTQGAVRKANGCTDTDNNNNDFDVVTAPVPRNLASPATPCGGGGTPTPTITPTPTPTPTPTATPTPPPGPATAGIKINEIYPSGGNAAATFNQDYVELFNSGTTNVDISGYSLQYAAATNTTATGYGVCAITASDTVIEPNTYFLISVGAASTTVGGAIPAANAACPTLALGATAGKIALASSTAALNGTTCPPTGAAIVDFVGYGATANCSETAPATAPANNQSSIQRTPIGADTNNNMGDFTSGAPSATAGNGTIALRDANVDFDGDGRSDYAVTRNSGSKIWYTITNGSGTFTGTQFGVATDIDIPEDYDGDNKDDLAVWRSGSSAFFFIFQSSTNTLRTVQFGITGDDPKVVADYDGDNKADIAVYRPSAQQGVYYYLSSITGNLVSTAFGSGNVRPNVGDYDGDGKADYCVHINSNGSGVFVLLKSTGGTEFINFGLPTDRLVPGDYDGDGKSDFTVVRTDGSQLIWYTQTRTNVFTGVAFGISTDIIAPGDYDGDGKQDVSVWRPDAGSSASVFYSLRSSNTSLNAFQFGVPTDYPVANWYVH